MITRRSLLQSCAAPALFAAGEKTTIGFATGTYGMRSMPTAAALRTLAEIGYDGVQLCLIAGWPSDPATLTVPDRQELRNLLRDTKLAVPAVLENLQVAPGAEKRAANVDRLKLAIDLGNELVPGNPPVIDTVLGGKTADWEKLKGRIVDTLGEWAKIAESSHTTIGFKPHAGHAINTPERTLWTVKQVNSKRIRVIYDYSHFWVEGFGLESSLSELLPYTAFIAVKDAVKTETKHEYLLPGDGQIDYLEYFRLLQQLHYTGWVGVEVSAMIHAKPGYEPVPTARLCYERLAPIFAKAGIMRPRR
jgi:inosose dehydratase